MFSITYFDRCKGKAVKAIYASLIAATFAAQDIFAATGVVVGIEAEA